jgi:hypothetical protein
MVPVKAARTAMLARRRLALVAFVLSGLVLAACANGRSAVKADVPASVEPTNGTGQARIHLSALAAKRLDIQSATIHDAEVPPRPAPPATTGPPVATSVPGPATTAKAVPATRAAEGTDTGRAATSGPPLSVAPTTTTTLVPATTLRKVIPYAAVLYQASGDAYTYTNPAPLVYVHQPITVDYVTGDLAVLTNGPPVGTVVVIVGGAELSGIETGVGYE